MHWFCGLQQGSRSAQLMLHFCGTHIGAGAGVGVTGMLMPASLGAPASLLLLASGVALLELELAGVLVVGVFVLELLADVLGPDEGVLVLVAALALGGVVLVGAPGGVGTLQVGVLSTPASPLSSDGSAPPASRLLNTLA
jgi:hypothetical protein